MLANSIMQCYGIALRETIPASLAVVVGLKCETAKRLKHLVDIEYIAEAVRLWTRQFSKRWRIAQAFGFSLRRISMPAR